MDPAPACRPLRHGQIAAGHLKPELGHRLVQADRLRQRAGQITPEDQKRVNQALDVSLGLDSYGTAKQ